MLKNYFLITWRNFRKFKIFSAINILGLSSGLACCILMFLFIQHELSYDQFNKRAQNIYRVVSDMENNGSKSTLAVTPAPWVPLMKKDFPEITEYVRLLKDEKILIGQPGEQHFYETEMLYADSTFFNVFSISLNKGDIKHALEKPNSIVLTEEAATKYFGTVNPIGKTLEVNSFGRNFNVEVTAIAEEAPLNSHFRFNALISCQTLGDLSALWSFHMFNSYVVLNDNVRAGDMEKKFTTFVKKYIINNPQADGNNDIHLQPLTAIHLHSHLVGELRPNGDATYVYVFAGVAIFILLIACFNFTNLSTARSLTRAKEVGLRKVVGADKKQLFTQFLAESCLFAFVALLLAIGIAWLVLPVFNELSGRQLRIDFRRNYSLVATMILLVTAVGLLAGLYPAAVLSSFKPIEVLKGKISRNTKTISFRKILVTIQFVVSIALIASTLLVNEQLHFLQNKKLGFDKENVVVLTLPRNTDSLKLQSFKSSLLNNDGISYVAASSTIPNEQVPINQVNNGGSDLSKALSMQMLFTDADFIQTMKMQLVAGRDWNKEMATDRTAGFIINEEAVKKLGWNDPQQAIGKTIQWVQPDVVLKSGTVIGVVKDFHITPLKTLVQPLVMHQFPQRYQYLYVRFDQKRAENVLSLIQKQFNAFYSKQSFEYSFLDETLNSLYSRERKLGSIFTYFSLLAIIIACLGVLGLSVYSIQQRIKEIGIRKVLGASVLGITGELVKEFLTPVLIGTVIATPLAWYAMHSWLKDFAYRIHINWWVFVIAGLLALCIALITVGFQSFRAALANPVKSLRTE